MKKFIYTFLTLLVCFISVFSFSSKSSAQTLSGNGEVNFTYTTPKNNKFKITSNTITVSSKTFSSKGVDVAPSNSIIYNTGFPYDYCNFSCTFKNVSSPIYYNFVKIPNYNYGYFLVFYNYQADNPFSFSGRITKFYEDGSIYTDDAVDATSFKTYKDSSFNNYYFSIASVYVGGKTAIPNIVLEVPSSYLVNVSGTTYVGLKLFEDIYKGDYTDPGSVGGAPDNALFDGNVGNLKNVQKHTVTKTEDYRNTGLSATIPTNYYWQFGWDKKTNLDYLLSDYYVGIKFVCDVGVPNGNGGYSYITNYSNGWNYFEKHATYSQAISQKFIISNFCNSHNITYDSEKVMAYSIKNIRFYLKPVVKHDNKFYYGGSTLVQFNSAGDGYNTVKTENVINPDDTDNPNKPSANQSGTGSDTHKHGYTDDSFSSGVEDFNSNLKTDLSGIRQATDEILESIKGIPQIFNSIFVWLPSWVISMFAWVIGFIILCIAISLIIKVVT